MSNIIYEHNEAEAVIDLRNEELTEKMIQEDFFKEVNLEVLSNTHDGYILFPNKSIIASTVESFVLPRNMFILLDGRSTLARFGITIHISASIVDNLNLQEPKNITLEIFNLGKHNFILYPKMPAAMVLFGLLSSESSIKPSEQYTGRQVLPNMKYIRDNGIL